MRKRTKELLNKGSVFVSDTKESLMLTEVLGTLVVRKLTERAGLM